MKYVCLGYYDAETMDALPASELDAVMSQCGPHVQSFYRTGQVAIDAGLAPETKVLRNVHGKVQVTDGRHAESKTMLGSVSIIEARDIDEAVQLASLHPSPRIPGGAAFGWAMEVRPIHHFFESPGKG